MEQLSELARLFESHDDMAVSINDGCVTVVSDDGIEIYLTPGSAQLIAETVLFSKSDVTDVNALNDLILESHQFVPLASIGTRYIGDATYYIAFGALSMDSKDEVIVEEVEALFASVPEFLDLYKHYLKEV